MLLPLQTGILYGPVRSRRYGRSLGINLNPGAYKLCSFNCIYCHYGGTDKLTVESALRSPTQLDVITFSGNGEPTLHPRFADIVDAVVRLRDEHRPGVKVALLSNSSGLGRPEVRQCIPRLDLPVFKLDAGTERTFRRVNRPAAGVKFGDIVSRLESLENVYIQTILIDGSPSNTHPDEILAYFERIREIRPRAVHMYSTDRPVPDTRVAKVDPEWLEELASQIEGETGVPAVAFHAAKTVRPRG
jgi:wyosine [tRNA(Phe)-imidazoG37] synthetase (radical SAM superfamily)